MGPKSITSTSGLSFEKWLPPTLLTILAASAHVFFPMLPAAANPIVAAAAPIAALGYQAFKVGGEPAFVYPRGFRVTEESSAGGDHYFAWARSRDARIEISFSQSLNFIPPASRLAFLISSGEVGESPEIHESRSDARTFACAGRTQTGKSFAFRTLATKPTGDLFVYELKITYPNALVSQMKPVVDRVMRSLALPARYR